MPSKFPCLGQKKLKYNATYPCSNGFLQSFIKLCSHNSLKAFDDGVVDSPPSHVVIPVAMNLPSPLGGKETSKFSKSKCWDTNGAQRNLYLGP